MRLHSVCYGKYLFQCIVSHLECSLSLTKAVWFLALLFLIILTTSAQWAYPPLGSLCFFVLICALPSTSPLPQGEKPFPRLSANSAIFVSLLLLKKKKKSKWSQWLYFSLSVVPSPLHPVQERYYGWTPHVKLYFKSYSAESTADFVLIITLPLSHPASSDWLAFGPTAFFCHLTWEISVCFFFLFSSSSLIMSLFSVWFLLWWHNLLHHSYTELSFICRHTSSTSLQVPQIGEGFSYFLLSLPCHWRYKSGH